LLAWLSGSFGACLNGNNIEGVPVDILKGYPLLELHKERVEELPEVVNFRSQRSAPYSTFDFPSSGDAEPIGANKRSCKSAPTPELAKLPRLTLTHAEDTENIIPLRLAAAIGKVRTDNWN
jgi:hypothetical protein